MQSPAEGASTSCYLAADPRLADVRGRYFINCNRVAIGGNSENRELAAWLWTGSGELVRPHLLAGP